MPMCAARNVLMCSLATILIGVIMMAFAGPRGRAQVVTLPNASAAHPDKGETHVPTITKDQARTLIENAVASLLDPNQDAESLSRYFAPDYTQDVDGKYLDYAGFVDHARTLKKTLRKGQAKIERLVVDGSTIADIHIIEAEKTNGEVIRAKVIAFFTLRDGKFIHVDELTHLLQGSETDQDLGSRTPRVQ